MSNRPSLPAVMAMHRSEVAVGAHDWEASPQLDLVVRRSVVDCNVRGAEVQMATPWQYASGVL